MEIIKDLPEIFDEFEDKKKQSFLKVKEYKEKQIPIIGAYCSFSKRNCSCHGSNSCGAMFLIE